MVGLDFTFRRRLGCATHRLRFLRHHHPNEQAHNIFLGRSRRPDRRNVRVRADRRYSICEMGLERLRVNAPRKHHYVPVFYQKNFANERELLWVYDRQCQTYRELHPKVICLQKDLYAIKPDDAPKDQRVESHALATLDGIFASALREFVAADKTQPDFPTIESIAYFVGFQSARLPSAGKIVSAVHKKGAEEIMRLTAVNVERMQSTLDQYAQSTGEKIDVSAESMVEAVHKNQFEIVINELPFLKSIFNHGTYLSKWLLRFSWEVFVASNETGFIFCDHPFVVVPPKGVRAVGFGIPGSVKYFPLTRQLCLRFGDTGPKFRCRDADRQTVRIINQNIAANSERFIIGPDIDQLKAIVSRSGSAAMDATPRFTLKSADVNDDGSYQILIQNPRRYFYLGNDSQAP
jgi:uncharacterized protein DUF4238